MLENGGSTDSDLGSGQITHRWIRLFVREHARYCSWSHCVREWLLLADGARRKQLARLNNIHVVDVEIGAIGLLDTVAAAPAHPRDLRFALIDGRSVRTVSCVIINDGANGNHELGKVHHGKHVCGRDHGDHLPEHETPHRRGFGAGFRRWMLLGPSCGDFGSH